VAACTAPFSPHKHWRDPLSRPRRTLHGVAETPGVPVAQGVGGVGREARERKGAKRESSLPSSVELAALACPTSSFHSHTPHHQPTPKNTDAPQQADLPPLIPLEYIYASPLATDPELSPDGQWLTYLAPAGKDNALNIWIGPVNNSFPVRPLTAEGPWDMASGQFQWTADSQYVLYLYDRGGGSRFRLYRQGLEPGSAPVDLLPRLGSDRPAGDELVKAGASGRPAPSRTSSLNATAAASPSADGRGVWGRGMRVAELFLSPGAPDEALVSVDARAPDLFDVWRLNLTSGRLAADVENPGDVVSWVPDARLHVRGARAALPGGWSSLRVRDSIHGGGDRPAEADAGAWPEVAKWGPGDIFSPITAAGQSGASFTPDGQAMWVLSSLGEPAARLVKVSTADGSVLEAAPVSPDAHGADVVEVLIDPVSGGPTASAADWLRRAWAPLTPEGKAEVATLTTFFNGSSDWSILSTTADGSKSVVKLTSDTQPTLYYFYDRSAGVVKAGVPELANLANYTLAPQEGVVIKARDGLELPCYLTMPVGVKNGTIIPLVIAVRSSPWGREKWGFSSTVQMLANRGYAVLQVNSRGATGFGKAFAAAGAGQWAGGMLDDYADAAAWAVQVARIATPGHVSVAGKGYGGYSALAAATMRADTFNACAASYGGPPSLRSPAVMWPGGLMQPFVAGALNTTTPEAAAALTPEAAAAAAAAASPLNAVSGLRLRGLMMGAGGRDDPGLLAATKAFAAAAAAGNATTDTPPVPDVRLYIYPNLAGAALRTDEDRLDYGSRGEQFMAACAGGRAGPPLGVVGANVDVVRGPTVPAEAAEGDGGRVRVVDPDKLREASRLGT
jgi:dipeptidyl aminopeptidase/acylaminoacyl peptidase